MGSYRTAAGVGVGISGLAIAATLIGVAVGGASPGLAPNDLAKVVTGASSASLRQGGASRFAGADRYLDVSTGDEYFVDTDSSSVVAYYSSRLDRPMHGVDGGVGQSAVEAIAAKADALLARCLAGSSSDRPQMVRNVSVNEVRPSTSADASKVSSGYSEVIAEYRLVKGGVRLPTAFSASYDGATGELLSFVQFSRSPSVSLTPSITKEEAITIAASRLRMPVHVVEDASLAVYAPEGGVQRLGWEVHLRTGAAGSGSGMAASIMIDALDGSTIWAPWSGQQDSVAR